MLAIERESLSGFNADRRDERGHQRFLAIVVAVFVLLLVGLLIFFGNAALTERVLIALISLAAGAFGGYGFGKSRED